MAMQFFEFSRYVIQQLGQIRLLILLGEKIRRRTIIATFTMVDVPLAYNVILGHPTLSAFQEVTSPCH